MKDVPTINFGIFVVGGGGWWWRRVVVLSCLFPSCGCSLHYHLRDLLIVSPFFLSWIWAAGTRLRLVQTRSGHGRRPGDQHDVPSADSARVVHRAAGTPQQWVTNDHHVRSFSSGCLWCFHSYQSHLPRHMKLWTVVQRCHRDKEVWKHQRRYKVVTITITLVLMSTLLHLKLCSRCDIFTTKKKVGTPAAPIHQPVEMLW